MDDDMISSVFLTSKSKYMLDSNPGFSSPLYTPGEEDPWRTGTSFDAVADMRGTLTHPSNAVTDDILEADVTAASVLFGIDLPEIFDTAFIRARPQHDRVQVEAMEEILHLGLPSQTVDRITSMVVPPGALTVTREEFNAALALMACNQKNMHLSLTTVYRHRNDLPLPLLPNLDLFQIKHTSSFAPHPSISEDGRNNLEDPWRLPQNANGKVKGPVPRTAPVSKTYSSSTEGEDPRTLVSLQDVKVVDQSGQWFVNLETVLVSMAREREGFIFKHVNYVVECPQRSSIVLRRYSDFFWLWEVLLKRYPFRIIPNLPPKKIGTRDEVFLDKRCKGLLRFINAIVRHPTLKSDDVVNIFLTEPSELLAWRRANPPSLDEEFVLKDPSTDELEHFIPSHLTDRLGKLEERLPVVIEHYRTMSSNVERMIRLREAQGAEYSRYASTLIELCDVEDDCYVTDCQGCPQVVQGYQAEAKHLRQTGTIHEEHASATANGLLESLRQYLDILLSLKDMLERQSKYASNQIDALTSKIAASKAKVNQVRGVPGLENETERLDKVIQADVDRLTVQKRQDTFIRYCLASEVSYVHKQQIFVHTMYQKDVSEQLRFSRRMIENWKALQVLTCNVPELKEFA